MVECPPFKQNVVGSIPTEIIRFHNSFRISPIIFLKYMDSSDNKVTSFYKGSNPLLTVMVDW